VKSIPIILAAALSLLAAHAAELKPVDETGYARLVAASKGKVTLVNFWATYCVPCRKEMPQLVALEARLRARGFQLVTISADEPEQTRAAAQLLAQYQAPAPYYRKQAQDDDKFARAIDPKWDGALPASFLYDKQGRKVRAFFGAVNIAALAAAIEKLL
jgi:thiol-disulfide isomerase/thioredoxin